MATAAPSWTSFQLQIPGQSFLESVRNILETLLIFLEILKTLLETIKMLLVLFGNPIAALVRALIALINVLFEALKRSGFYAWFDVPNPLVDPGFNRFVGGYQGFVTRFKGSLVDIRDPNRPQPIAGATQSGFLMMVVDAEAVEGLVRLITLLLRFFGKDFLSPQYGAPANVKVLPVGDKGDPILSIVKVFQLQPTTLVVEWALPSTQNVGDPGFSDVFSSFSTEFVPPKFLIEKSAVNPSQELDSGNLGDPAAAGVVTAVVPTNFEIRGQVGKTLMRKVRVTDNYGDPFIKFQKYIVIDPSQNAGTFFLGQLGTFRYIDKDVTVGKRYWYRVRAFSGDLTVNTDGSISFATPKANPQTNIITVQWPGDTPVMGRASVVAQAAIPVYAPNFDVIENLKRLFQLAFSLNFHVEPPIGAKFDSNGLPADITTTTNSNIGQGSLTQQAGSLVSFTAVPVIGAAAGIGAVQGQFASNFEPDPVTGKLPQLPWQTFRVVSNSTRLATIVAGAFLQNGAAVPFKALMEGNLPKGPPAASGLGADTTLSKLVFHLTTVDTDASVMRTIAKLYGDSFADPNLRLNILAAVNFCKAYTLGGAPPDWIQISFLRDIIPWSGQLLYELLAKIQALLDALKGIFDEIIAFINLIERKIDTLEKFIEYLISILDFLLSLKVGFFLLFLPESNGDVTDWFSAIDNAGGSRPPSGPGGYTAGVVLAYLAPNITAFTTALKLIF